MTLSWLYANGCCSESMALINEYCIFNFICDGNYDKATSEKLNTINRRGNGMHRVSNWTNLVLEIQLLQKNTLMLVEYTQLKVY